MDQDCDGLVDVGAADASAWCRDADGDGFGDAGDCQEACAQPEGYVADSTDCDDGDAESWPGSDLFDADCKEISEEPPGSTWDPWDEPEGGCSSVGALPQGSAPSSSPTRAATSIGLLILGLLARSRRRPRPAASGESASKESRP